MQNITKNNTLNSTDLDNTLSKIQRGKVTLISGRPTSGKSTFARNLCERAAKNHELLILYFSMKMTAKELSALSQTSLSTWKKNDFHIDDSCGLSVQDIKEKARQFTSKTKKNALILIDYLQLIRIKNENQVDVEPNNILMKLEQLALELDCIVVVVNQLKKGESVNKNNLLPEPSFQVVSYNS